MNYSDPPTCGRFFAVMKDGCRAFAYTLQLLKPMLAGERSREGI